MPAAWREQGDIVTHRRSSGWARAVSVVAALVAATLPPRAVAWWLADEARPAFRGEAHAERAIALGEARWGSVTPADFGTGSALFDREWAFGTPMMRAACLAQVILRHPDLEAELAPHLGVAAADLAAPGARAFTVRQWRSDPLEADVPGHDHAAFLGYGGFALGLTRAAATSPAAEDNYSVMMSRLRSRLRVARGRWLETYPGEVYPVDVASAVGAAAIDARLRGRDPLSDPDIAAALERVRGATDPATGLLYQAIDPETGEPRDGPRGSGTLLAAYFILPADPDLSRAWFEAGRRELADSVLGFGVMRERPRSAPGHGDIDSGPIVFGYGVSATGFAIAPARAFGDEGVYTTATATAALFGAPTAGPGGERSHVTGGPLGDAILCAMGTSPTPAEVAVWLDRVRS